MSFSLGGKLTFLSAATAPVHRNLIETGLAHFIVVQYAEISTWPVKQT